MPKLSLSLLFTLCLAVSMTAHAEIFSWQTEESTASFGDEPINTPSSTVTPSPTNTFASPAINDNRTSTTKITKKNTVTLYTTSWCGFCRKARKYFKDNNIKFIEYDIENSARAANTKKQLDKRHKRSGVPLAVINNKVIYGYRPNAYQDALN